MHNSIKNKLLRGSEITGQAFVIVMLVFSVTLAIFSLHILRANMDTFWSQSATNLQAIVQKIDNSNIHNLKGLPQSMKSFAKNYFHNYERLSIRYNSLYSKFNKDFSFINATESFIASLNNHQIPNITQISSSIFRDLIAIQSVNKPKLIHKQSQKIISNIEILIESAELLELDQNEKDALTRNVFKLHNTISKLRPYLLLRNKVKRKELGIIKIKDSILTTMILQKSHFQDQTRFIEKTYLKLASIVLASLPILFMISFYFRRKHRLTLASKDGHHLKELMQKKDPPAKIATPEKKSVFVKNIPLDQFILDLLQTLSIFIKNNNTRVVFSEQTECIIKADPARLKIGLKNLIKGLISLAAEKNHSKPEKPENQNKEEKHQNEIKISLIAAQDETRINLKLTHLELTEELLWETWRTETHSHSCLDEVFDQIEKISPLSLKNHYEENGNFHHAVIEMKFEVPEEASEVNMDN